MKWYKNLKIRPKLLISFIFVTIVSVIALGYAIVAMLNLDKSYTNLLEYRVQRLIYLQRAWADLGDVRRIFNSIDAYVSDTEKLNSVKQDFNVAVKSVKDEIGMYTSVLIQDDVFFSPEEKTKRVQIAEEMVKDVTAYQTQCFDPKMAEALAKNALEDSYAYLRLASSISRPLMAELQELVDEAIKATNDSSEAASSDSLRATYIAIVITAVVAIITILIAMYVANCIATPINELVLTAQEIADGNLNVNVRSDANDETGQLSQAFSVVIKNLHTLIREVGAMYKAQDAGDLSVTVDESAFSGSYRELASGVNRMVKSYTDIFRDVLAALGNMAKGNMNVRLKEQYRGEKGAANRAVEGLARTTKGIITSIDDLTKEAKNGNLSVRTEHAGYEGEWEKILIGLNGLLETVSVPINNSAVVLETVSKGRFNARMEGDFKGDFRRIKEAVNGTVSTISVYIEEISQILATIAEGDLTKNITREYIGDFSAIKDAINNILSSLNTTMQEITTASGQVLTSSKQISQSAMLLAQGATEQSSSVEELTATVDEINSQTQDNSKNAQLASTLAATSKSNAEIGNSEMQKLLEAMEGITLSSQKISNIIKTIEDIASQTNLLALNASVEAARAGEHGLGFTVVAGEVRSLASKSQEAAKETNALIQESIERVNDGTKRAGETANSLSQIVGNAVNVSEVINKIYEASVHQAESISNVGVGLGQISQVVQSNSATSQQSAAASQELNSQSETLQNMIAFFKVK